MKKLINYYRHFDYKNIYLLLGAEYATALKFVNPIVYYAQDKLGLSWEQLKGKCDKNRANLFHKVEQLRDLYDLKSAGVKDEILNKAKKYCPVNDAKWDELINQKCFPNQSLISIANDAIDSIQRCLDKKEQLNKKQKENAKRELLKRFCSMIKIW